MCVYLIKIKLRMVIWEMVDDFVDCFFGGDKMLFVWYFIEDFVIGLSEIEEFKLFVSRFE